MTQTKKATRYFYAMSDSFTGDNPDEWSSGFANTKVAIAFVSKAARDKWLSETQLLTAKAIARKEAEKLTSREPGEYYRSDAEWVRAIRIYGTGEGYDASYVFVAESIN